MVRVPLRARITKKEDRFIKKARLNVGLILYSRYALFVRLAADKSTFCLNGAQVDLGIKLFEPFL